MERFKESLKIGEASLRKLANKIAVRVKILHLLYAIRVYLHRAVSCIGKCVVLCQ